MNKRVPVHLKCQEDHRESLDIEVEVGRDQKVVTLHMLEFDGDQVGAFLTNGGLREFGVRIDDSLFEDILTLPLHRLVVNLAGRKHPARLQYLSDGRVSLRLGDPDAEYLGRCMRAIELVLSRLHAVAIGALVLGIDQYGRPAPTDGRLELYARLDAGEEPLVARVVAGVEQETGVRIAATCDVGRRAAAAELLERTLCWAWAPDVRQVVPLPPPGSGPEETAGKPR